MSEFNSTLSIYIPIVDEKINDTAIKAVFEHLGLGVISRVDFVYSSLGKKQAFLHFTEWFDCEKSHKVQRDILDPGTNARLVYDNPKFWPLLQNRNPVDKPNLDTPNIIDVLQTKIEMLESKLNAFGIASPDYEGLGKRSRLSSEFPFMNKVCPPPSNEEMSAAFNYSPPPRLRRMHAGDSCGSITGAYKADFSPA
jgi:hypothetical protein